MPSKRQFEIISFLSNQQNWMTSNDMCNYIHVSTRTIKSDISSLNHEYNQLIESSRNGYKINKEIARQILQEHSKTIPDSFYDRKRYILKELLLKQTISFEDACQSLFISDATLQNDLNKIRNEINKDGLNLHIKKSQISISGSDRAKHKILLSFINEELENSLFSLNSIQKFFPDINIHSIKAIIDKILYKYEYFLDDYSTINYVIHIAMMIKNCREGIENKDVSSIYIPEEFREILQKIYSLLKDIFPYSFSIGDLSKASSLMFTRIMRQSKLPEKQKQFVQPQIKNLINEIALSVQNNYAIQLKGSHFEYEFAFHIQNLVIRLNKSQQLVNLQFKQIKSEYPLLYSISVLVCKTIEQYTQKNISEDEIAFIVLHIGIILEEQRIYDEKVICGIYAPDYYALGNRISKQLQQHFSKNLYIQNTFTSYSQIKDFEDLELIITTVQNLTGTTTILQIKPFLDEHDFFNCYKTIEQIIQNKRKKKIVDKFDYFFNQESFFVNSDVSNKEEAIKLLCTTLEQQDVVLHDYKNRIYERESISTSAFGNVAIPHPLQNYENKSRIAIILSDKGIQWDKNLVNVVFMLALKKEDHTYFVEIFEFIQAIISSKTLLSKFLKIKSYNDFIEFVLNTHQW